MFGRALCCDYHQPTYAKFIAAASKILFNFLIMLRSLKKVGYPYDALAKGKAVTVASSTAHLCEASPSTIPKPMHNICRQPLAWV
jgi:hypothetical protein